MFFDLDIWGQSNIRQDTENILQMLQNNPFGVFQQMKSDEMDDFVLIDKTVVLDELGRKNLSELPISIDMIADEPFEIGAGISHSESSCGVSIEINRTDVSKINVEQVKKYLKQWRNVLPKFARAKATADDRNNEFWMDVAKVFETPDCFGSRLGWYHVISPQEYEYYFTAEELLESPAFEVEKLDDGTICFQSYEHPLDFDKPETTEKIIEITNYLNEKWMAKNPEPTVDIVDGVIVLKRRR